MAGKRLLNFNASDFLSATPMELKQAILASEGRTIMAENVPGSPLLLGATNAEYERMPVRTCSCSTRSTSSTRRLPACLRGSKRIPYLGLSALADGRSV